MKITDQVLNVDMAYRGLYKAGATAALIAAAIFRRNLDAEWVLLRGMGIIKNELATTPSTIHGWFTLLQENKLLGLTFLNFFDLVNYALVGMIFLALIAALRQISPSGMVLAAALSFTGIAVYFASSQTFTILSLSNQYAASITDAQRELYLAAGQAALAIHQNNSYASSGIYVSFLLLSVAGLIISLAMVRSSIFSSGCAWMGILANGFHLSYYITLISVPAFVFIPISISAIFLLIWYILLGIRLWVLGSYRNATSSIHSLSSTAQVS